MYLQTVKLNKRISFLVNNKYFLIVIRLLFLQHLKMKYVITAPKKKVFRELKFDFETLNLNYKKQINQNHFFRLK